METQEVDESLVLEFLNYSCIKAMGRAGEVYLHSSFSTFTNTKQSIMKVKFIKEITVIDPDTNSPVELSIYKEEAGGIIGIDSSFLSNTEEDVISPFGNGKLEIE